MPQLPVTTPQKAIKALEKSGFFVDRIVGSHYILMHPEKPQCKVTVAFHRRDLKRGTLTSIIKQAGMTVEEFSELL